MKKIALFFCFILFACYFFSCKKSGQIYPQDFNFQPELEKNRIIYKSFKIDLDNDNLFELIYLISSNSKPAADSFYNFDEIKAFRWNKYENKYDQALDDSVYFGEKVEFLNLTLDSVKYIILTTNSGGDDSVNSLGMKLYYSIPEQKISKIFDMEFGNPELTDINNDGNKELLIYKSIMPGIININPVKTYSEIYKIEKNKSIIANFSFNDFSNKIYFSDSLEYYKEKNKKKPDIKNLFKAALKFIFETNAIISPEKSINIWNNEKLYLKKAFNADEYTSFIGCLSNEGFEMDNEIGSQIDIMKISAEEHMKNKRFDEALKCFESILSIDPGDIDAYVKIGIIYYDRANYIESLNYFLQAALFVKEDKRIYLGAGKNYEKLENKEEALNAYKKYLLYDSTSVEAKRIQNYVKLNQK
jgi:tetratricopeptide (TPR) repeat protein